MPSVSIPGPTALTRTPYRPSSTASARTIASTAAFGADERPSRIGNRVVAAVVTATSEPAEARSAGSAACATAKKPAASAESWSAIASGSTRDRWTIGTCGPAAWTTVCRPRRSATAWSTTRPTSRRSSRSTEYDASPTCDGRVRCVTATRAPRSSSISATQAPDAARAADDQRATGEPGEVRRAALCRRSLRSRELDRVPPGGTVGQDVALYTCLHVAILAGRPDAQLVVPLVDLDLGPPLHPGVVARAPARGWPPSTRRRRARPRPARSRCAASRPHRRTRACRPSRRRRRRARRSSTRSSPAPPRTSPGRSSRPRSRRSVVTSMSTTHLQAET